MPHPGSERLPALSCAGLSWVGFCGSGSVGFILGRVLWGRVLGGARVVRLRCNVPLLASAARARRSAISAAEGAVGERQEGFALAEFGIGLVPNQRPESTKIDDRRLIVGRAIDGVER